MNGRRHIASRLDLLKWVSANSNKPFDPNMVVPISTGHTSDWEWQAVLAQMEDLRVQGYITRVRQDSSGSTYWTITQSGERYLNSLSQFEQAQHFEGLYPQTIAGPRGAEMTLVGGWEQLRHLGEGGQSNVFLVRSPQRVKMRREATSQILATNPWAPYVGGNPNEQLERVDRLAASLSDYARPDDISELGARY